MSNSSAAASGDVPNESGWSTGTKRLIAIGVAALVLVGLALPKMSDSTASDQEEGGSDDAPTGVAATVLEPGSVPRQIRTNGTLQADESVELTAEAGGRITDIRFEEGTRVQEGDLLVQINDEELRAQKQRLEHELQLASDRAGRQKRLLQEGGVSQEEYDATVNEVKVLKAEVSLVEAQIEKKTVRAPFSGIVGLREVSEGAYVSPQTSITTLQRIDPIKINFSVSEQYATQVQPGQPLTFSVRGRDGTMEGQVYATDTQVDADTRTLQLRARAPNSGVTLRPGMYADVTLDLGTIKETIVVPSFAVTPALNTQRVFVAEGGTAQPRNVAVGVRTDSTVQITDGLAVGDTVITSGIQDLRAGLPVRVETLE